MFAAGLLILGILFGVLLTIVGTVWLGSLADEGIPQPDPRGEAAPERRLVKTNPG